MSSVMFANDLNTIFKDSIDYFCLITKKYIFIAENLEHKSTRKKLK